MEPINAETVADTFDHAVAKLFRYDIFPPSVMRFALCSSDRIAENITIVQSVRLAPAIAIESGVRVTDVWERETDRGRETGFRYVALSGHPERGWSSFTVRTQRGAVYFEIEAQSFPGTALARLFRPFSRAFQRSATQAALRYFTGREARS